MPVRMRGLHLRVTRDLVLYGARVRRGLPRRARWTAAGRGLRLRRMLWPELRRNLHVRVRRRRRQPGRDVRGARPVAPRDVRSSRRFERVHGALSTLHRQRAVLRAIPLPQYHRHVPVPERGARGGLSEGSRERAEEPHRFAEVRAATQSRPATTARPRTSWLHREPTAPACSCQMALRCLATHEDDHASGRFFARLRSSRRGAARMDATVALPLASSSWGCVDG
jgi:hypothetical protein